MLGGQWIAYRINPNLPLTEESRGWIANYPGNNLVESAIPDGLMVISQTCDIRREVEVRPYLEVAPLIKISEPEFQEATKGRRPRLAAIPALRDACLVADLDRVFTVEKSEAATWNRTPGNLSDEERRRLSHRLAQKRGRPALPDDFQELMVPLITRWKEKKGKRTAEGAAILDLAEVRVQASPHWYAQKVRLDFWFILDEGTPLGDPALISQWLGLLDRNGRFGPISGGFTFYDILKVSEYLDSDEIDTERISPS